MDDQETFDLLVDHGTAAADPFAIDFRVSSHEGTKDIIARALRCLLDNGLVTVVPRDEWPTYVYPDGKPSWMESAEVGSTQENRPATG